MNIRLITLWDNVRNSLWFVPMFMALGAIALSFLTIKIDHSVESDWVRTVGWLWAGGVEGARAVLSTIAGSIITVAGVTFSITITALTLASSQFGPRLLRNFMRDTGNQLVLGTFIATFLYCLLVLRTVRSVEDIRFVPYISVSVGMMMAIVSLGVLIYFIHHMAESIQADNLAASVAEELYQSIDRLFPEKLGHGSLDGAETITDTTTDKITSSEAPTALDTDLNTTAYTIHARKCGYIQSVDSERLMKLACEHDLIIRLCKRPGDFVAQGNEIAQVRPAVCCYEGIPEAVSDIFVIGRHRTATQDVRFSVNQLVEIAVRALSPGINDPRTAITCIDWLGGALGHIAQREIPSAQRHDETGQLRIVAEPMTFDLFTSAALSEIRQYGSSSVSVTVHLLKTIAEVAVHVRRKDDFNTLRQHADLITDDGRTHCINADDKQIIQTYHQQVLRALKSHTPA